MKIRCFVCGQAPIVTDEQLDTHSTYNCPVCETQMSRSQWRRIRAGYFMASDIDERLAAERDEGQYCEIKLFQPEYFFDSEEAEAQYFPGLR